MRLPFLALATVVALCVIPATASAVTVSKASLLNGQLSVQGTGAPGILTTAESSVSSAGARSDIKGAFKISATGFSAPDCMIVVRDRQTAPATVLLSGCVSTVKPVTAPAAPTGSCRLVAPVGTTSFVRNTNSVLNFLTTGCSTAAFGDLKFSVVAGAIPVGMTGPFNQGADAANIIGSPTLAGTYTFQVKVTDKLGQSDWENYTIKVA